MTIVVPVKNRATLVLRTLNSIKAQTWRPIKLIVVDNGSTDGTAESVGNWIRKNESPGFEVSLIEELTPGAAAARNAGLEAVDTRLMMFFDSDDIMAPTHVESIMKRFHAGDEPDLVQFRLRFHPIDGEDRITKRPGRDVMVTHICHGVMRTAAFACETALARRSGAWDVETRSWDDLEFGSRLIMEARRRVFIPDVNVDIFAQVDSITGTEFSSRRGEWELVLDKMVRDFDRSRHKNRFKWLKVIEYKRAILAAMYHKEGSRDAARDLLDRALSNPSLNWMQRTYIKLSYRFTSIGGRGSAAIINWIF